jgi:hypothetical protein
MEPNQSPYSIYSEILKSYEPGIMDIVNGDLVGSAIKYVADTLVASGVPADQAMAIANQGFQDSKNLQYLKNKSSHGGLAGVIDAGAHVAEGTAPIWMAALGGAALSGAGGAAGSASTGGTVAAGSAAPAITGGSELLAAELAAPTLADLSAFPGLTAAGGAGAAAVPEITGGSELLANELAAPTLADMSAFPASGGLSSVLTADNLLKAGTRAIPGLLGAVGSNQQADAIRDIEARARADRAPFLDAATSYLRDPNAYISGPGAASMQGVLRRLSATHGNPIGNPTALATATEAGLRDWREAVLGFGNLGLAGEDTRSNLALKATGADANVLNALGGAAADVFNPPKSLADIVKEIEGARRSSGSTYSLV